MVMTVAMSALLNVQRPTLKLNSRSYPSSVKVCGMRPTVFWLISGSVLKLVLMASTALHFVASRGYVHLDVKPDNIIMGAPPRLIDLSVARSHGRAERLRGIVGTDAYMAPEQCDPEAMPGRIGPPADVWGLGATLFHAVSGEKPFPPGSGDGGPERFPQLVEDPRPLPDWVPPELSELILEMLDRDPARRLTCAEAVRLVERAWPS